MSRMSDRLLAGGLVILVGFGLGIGESVGWQTTLAIGVIALGVVVVVGTAAQMAWASAGEEALGSAE